MQTFTEYETQVDKGDGWETDQVWTSLAKAKKRMQELLQGGLGITEVRVIAIYLPLDF